MMPSSASFSLNVVATETLSNTASTATPASALLLVRAGCRASRRSSSSSGSTSSRLFGPAFFGFGAE